MDRRDFLTGAAAAATAWAVKDVAFPTEASAQAAPTQQLVTSVWSRHVQWVRTEAQTRADPFGTGVAVGEAIRAGGYAAVDLTVDDGEVVGGFGIAVGDRRQTLIERLQPEANRRQGIVDLVRGLTRVKSGLADWGELERPVGWWQKLGTNSVRPCDTPPL